MQYSKLPNTTLEVSRIAFGGWAIVGGFNWGPQDEKDSLEAIQTAFDQGINFFDTAEGYGNGKSEELLFKAIGQHRKQTIIATKISPADFAYKDARKACERRLKAMHSDYIDILQLHWPNPEVPVEDTIQALEELKAEGKIRYYGVSNFGVRDLTAFLSHSTSVISNQLPYNLIWRAIEFEILPLCAEKNIPVLCYSPIMQGLLAGKFSSAEEVPDDRARTRHFSHTRSQVRHQEEGCEDLTFETIGKIRKIAEKAGHPMSDLSLAWLLAQKGVGAVIVGGRNGKQVQRNVKAADVVLSQDIIQELNEATEPLKQKLGKNADMWQTESRIH
jgi:aryl-alcohol dehydrogenase-like predicted oxidoreductase